MTDIPPDYRYDVQGRCDVLSDSVYDYDYCCDNEPGYFDYDGPHHYEDDEY